MLRAAPRHPIRAALSGAARHRPFTAGVVRRQDSAAYKAAHESVQAKFVEARDEYETAVESANTTYAYEDNEVARLASRELQALWALHTGQPSSTSSSAPAEGAAATEVNADGTATAAVGEAEDGEGALQLPESQIIAKLKEKDEYTPVELTDGDRQKLKERLGARIRELVNGVENNLHDH